jgi:putative hydrolase of HD superfamily
MKTTDGAKNNDQYKNILNFLFETGAAEKIKRTGPWVYGVKDPENIAEHCYRTAIITFILANLEGADVYKLTVYSLFHDIHELRLLDRNGISHKYMETPNSVVDAIHKDQFEPLGKEIDDKFGEVFNISDKEFLLVKDADFIDDGLRVKEYTAKGILGMDLWIDEIGSIIQTESAKKLWEHINTTSYVDWVLLAKQSTEEIKKDYFNKK